MKKITITNGIVGEGIIQSFSIVLAFDEAGQKYYVQYDETANDSPIIFNDLDTLIRQLLVSFDF